MVDRKLRGVSEYSIYILFGPQDILKVVKKSVPEISTYGAASHLKRLITCIILSVTYFISKRRVDGGLQWSV
jgi:hypothetical protein